MNNNSYFRSNNFTINLAQKITYFNQNQAGINYNDLFILFIGMVIFISGIYTIVEYRKFRKEKLLNPRDSSFKIFLKNKIRKSKQISHQELRDETIQKLEEIIEENSK